MNEVPYVYMLCVPVFQHMHEHSSPDCIDGSGCRIDRHEGAILSSKYYFSGIQARWASRWWMDSNDLSQGGYNFLEFGVYDE